MRENYAESLKRVLVHEGGMVDDPRDPGGATNQGVTQAVYDAYRRNKQLSRRHVFAMVSGERDEIYRQQYWDVIRGDALPSGVDYAVFDYAVNSGCVRSIKALQKALGVTADGVIGNVTLAAARTYPNQKALVGTLCNTRLSFLQALATWSVFGRGWRNRVIAVRTAAIAMA